MDDLLNIINSIKGKKVAFFHSHVLWASHFETELELIELLQENNTSIISYICNDELKCCDNSLVFNISACSHCIAKRKMGLKLVDKTIIKPIEIKAFDFPIDPEISVTEFVKLRHKNFDFGYAVLSSMIQHTRDPYIRIKDYHSEFQQLVNTSISLFDYFVKSLKEEQVHTIFIFNGRFVHSRSLLRAAEFLNISYYTHERGSSKDKFMLFKNTMPHDIEYFHSNMMHIWADNNIDLDQKMDLSKSFYNNRRKGNPREWVSFIGNQKLNYLPVNFNSSKYNIGIFLSSEDEFSAIGDKRKRLLFESQIEGLKFIFNQIYKHDEFHFYIRMHPNSSKSEKFINDIKYFESDIVTVLEPISPVHTYYLLDNVDKVITFGSTIGVEATYWDKPVINLDNAFYYYLNVTYNPKNKSEIHNLILDKDLSPKPKENALPYGYYLSVFGYDFKFYNADTFTSGYYRGIDLNEAKGIAYRKAHRYKFIPYRISKLIYLYKIKFFYFFFKKYNSFY